MKPGILLVVWLDGRIFVSVEEGRRFCPPPMITQVCTGALCNGQGEQLTHERMAEEDGVVGSPRYSIISTGGCQYLLQCWLSSHGG